MNAKTHKRLVAAVLCLGVFFFAFGSQDLDEIYAEEDAKQAEALKAQARAKEKEEKELQAKAWQEKQEKRAGMPQFAFGGFTLTDTPQQVIEKGIANYKIATTFPVEQQGKTIKVYRNRVRLDIHLLVDNLLDDFEDFFPGYNWSIPIYRGIHYTPSKDMFDSGLIVDVIDLTANQGDALIRYYYITYPGKGSKVLCMAVTGDLVQSAPGVFQDRYGKPANYYRSNPCWFSRSELAMFDSNSSKRMELYMFNKSAAHMYGEIVVEAEKAAAARKKAAADAEDIRRAAEEKDRRGRI